MTLRSFAAFCLLFSVVAVLSAEEASRAVEAPLIDSKIVVDGTLDDAAWKQGPWTSGFVVFLTSTSPLDCAVSLCFTRSGFGDWVSRA